jgi:GTP-binding protein Era
MSIEPKESKGTRAGTVAVIGRPNAGKSTLMNGLVGEHLSIASRKAQTTWKQVTGIVTTSTVQAVIYDTPGLLEPRDMHQRALVQTARDTAADTDVIVLVVDAADAGRAQPDPLLADVIERARGLRLCALNKMDRVDPPRMAELADAVRSGLGAIPFPISAQTGEGLEALMSAIGERLPESPFLYPEDQIGTAPVRFFVSELVRECVFEQFREELPYATLCAIDEFREGEEPCYIRAIVYVEKPTQKAILIGEGGAAIKALGTAARKKIEHFMDRRVYLDLWVKVLPNWRRKRHTLARFGFHVPPDAQDK